jgi:hypothetical protein
VGRLLETTTGASFVTKGTLTGGKITIRTWTPGTIPTVTISPFTTATKAGFTTGAIIITTITAGGEVAFGFALWR